MFITRLFFVAEYINCLYFFRGERIEFPFENQIVLRLRAVKNCQFVIVRTVRNCLRHAVKRSDAASSRKRDYMLCVLHRLIAKIAGRITQNKSISDGCVIK